MERNVGALTTRTLVAYYFNFRRLAKALSQYLPCVEHSSPLFSSGGSRCSLRGLSIFIAHWGPYAAR